MKKKLLYSIIVLLIGSSLSFLIWLVIQEKSESPAFGKDKPEGYAEFKQYITGTPDGSQNSYKVNYRLREYYKAIDRTSNLKRLKATLNWKERGPGNVGGRTRALILDPRDTTNSTWYAGSVSGGVWRTTDKAATWENLTEDIPVLSTTCLTMCRSNPEVMYVGTGEGFGGYGMVIGNGIFKSTQSGDAGTWLPLDSTLFNKDFEYVNRIVVDYNSPDTVLVCTNTGIFKSIDGGDSWYNVYRLSGHWVQQILPDPNNFNILYASVNKWGIVKSTDKGETWFNINNGIIEAKRFELAISPVNTNRIFASVEGYGNQTIIYYSSNGGEKWHRFMEKDGNYYNFLRSQGWFDNTIVCHPYDEDIIYIGGVFLGKIEFSNTTEESEAQVMRVDTFKTASMIDFVSFGGRYFGGALAVGSDEEGEELEEEDWRSVEIRMGNTHSQKAHRFVVPDGSGAGVPPDKYSYVDYVNVPFEVWDTDNNTQLMVSFRDNERDTIFNVLEFDDDKPARGREYFFIHGVPYNGSTPNEEIAQEAGYTYKLLYFLWPTLQPDSIWEPGNLDGTIQISYGKYVFQKGSATTLADDTRNKNLHVDHHQLLALKTDESNKSFMLLNANDGGLGISEDGGLSWRQITDGYNTTQFYGVAKKPGSNEYIGGMQDNGTWQSKSGSSAAKNTEYFDRLGGDGFEVLWHPDYPQRIIGSTYNNYFSVTNNGGEDWNLSYDGIDGDGPFVSRLSHSPGRPNIIYAVGGRGVYIHYNFGLGKQRWNLIPIYNDFSVDERGFSHDVEVSLANRNIVWAGTGMYKNPDLRIFVSTNGGFNFQPTTIYNDARLGFSTSIVTHPELDSTAFVLFSVAEKPKILRTDNLGETWTDISGFGDNDTSNNGFPDVIVYSLLVHPENNDVLWAGTEIGLFESLDNGATWAYADNGLPAVSIFQIQVIDNQIIVGTHGRGIWTLDLNGVGVEEKYKNQDIKWSVYPNPVDDEFTIDIDPEYVKKINQVDVININGQVMLTRKVLEPKSKIQVHDLPKGTYIVQLYSDTEIFQKKILKK